MGSATGSSSPFLHSPLHYSLFSKSPSPCAPFLNPSPRNALTRRKNRAAMACLKQENPEYDNFCKRRVMLYMGFVAIPLLNMRAEAVEGLVAGEWDFSLCLCMCVCVFFSCIFKILFLGFNFLYCIILHGLELMRFFLWGTECVSYFVYYVNQNVIMTNFPI